MPNRRLPLLETTRSVAGDGGGFSPARPEDRKVRPRYAVWELTLKCDLACHHCGSRAGRARPDELSLEEALDLVKQLAEMRVAEVTLIGGEAYLYEGWLEVVRAITERGMVCTMTTGGRGFTTELAQQAKEAGLSGISVSIDGPEEFHDALRGVKGAYRAALRAFEAARGAGLAVAMNTNVNRRNLGHIASVFELALEQECHGWQVFLTVPMGRAADQEDLILQPEDLLGFMPLLVELKGRAREAGLRLLPGNNVGYFGPGDARLRADLGHATSGSCSAGRSTLGIEANGDIKGCPSLFTRDWVAGNIRKNSLQEIWQQSDKMRTIRDRTVDDLWGYCRTCYYAEQCKAGCSWTASALFGRPGNNPYCHHRALDFRSRGKRERLVQTSAAPGTAFDRGAWKILVESTDAAPPSLTPRNEP